VKKVVDSIDEAGRAASLVVCLRALAAMA